MVGRIPMALNTVALVFLISTVRDSFALAGVVSSCYTLANAFAGPRIGRLADRLGPRRVLIPVTILNLFFTSIVIYFADKSVAALLVSASLMGATFPGIGSYTRTRWSHTIKDEKLLETALSLEAVMDEVGFAIGPALAGFLFSWYGSKSPLIGGMVFLIIGGFGLALTSVEHIRNPLSDEKHGGLLKIRFMRSLLVSLICLGLVFGAQFVVILAVAKEGHRAADGGLWVGLNPIGSTIAGLLYGLVKWKIPTAKRLTYSLAIMAFSTTGLVIFQSLHTIVFFLIFAGLAIAPALISANARLKELVPTHRLNEAFALLGASISIGITIGSTLSGMIVAKYGGWNGFYFMLASTILAALVSLFGWRGEKV